MNIKQLLKDEGEKLGFSDEELLRAQKYAEAVSGQGKDIKETLAKDLPEELIEAIRIYMRATLNRAKIDPEFRKKFLNDKTKKLELN